MEYRVSQENDGMVKISKSMEKKVLTGMAALMEEIETLKSSLSRQKSGGRDVPKQMPKLQKQGRFSVVKNETTTGATRRKTIMLSSEFSKNNFKRAVQFGTSLPPNFEPKKELNPILQNSAVAIIGLGKIGSRLADILARSGVGRLFLVDNGTVEHHHLCGTIYHRDHVSLLKSQAMRLMLKTSEREIISENLDISSELDCDKLQLLLRSIQWDTSKLEQKESGTRNQSLLDSEEDDDENQGVQLLCCCVNDPKVRMVINNMSLKLGIPYLDGQLAQNAISGDGMFAQSIFVMPGYTACLECLPLKQLDNADKANDQNRSSLPGVELLMSGVLSANVLKFLLECGTFSHYITINRTRKIDTTSGRASSFWKLSNDREPFTDCPNALCKRRQKDVLES